MRFLYLLPLLLIGPAWGCKGEPSVPDRPADASLSALEADSEAGVAAPAARSKGVSIPRADNKAPVPTSTEPGPGPRAFGDALAGAEAAGLVVQLRRARMPDGRVIQALAVELEYGGDAPVCVSRIRCEPASICPRTSFLWPLGKPLVGGNDPGGNPHVFALPEADPEAKSSMGFSVLAMCFAKGESRTEFFDPAGATALAIEHWHPDLKRVWNASGLYEPIDGQLALRYDRLPEVFPDPPAPGDMVVPETRNQLLAKAPDSPSVLWLRWSSKSP